MRTRILAAVVGVTLALAAAPAAHAATFIGLTGNNGLIQFDSAYPGSPGAEIPITGLQQSESIHGIDFRPANGMLYGVGSSNRLYTINPTTGAATEVGPLGMAPTGTMFGFDFNPVSDRLVVATDADEVLVVDPNTGMATAGPPLMYAGGMQNPYIIGLAFSNNVPGATSTNEYGLDFSNNDLVMIDPATSLITPIGDLGPSPGPLTGFDITRDGMGFFASGPFFHTVNLATGNAPSAGMFPNPLFVKGLAAVPPAGSGPGPGPGGEPPPGSIPGDFNLDGTVDAADLVIFRAGLNASPNGVSVPLQAPDGLGASDQIDFEQWRMNFGRGAGGARAAQRGRRVTLVKARRRVTLGAGETRRVRLPLTKAGKRFLRGYKKKRLRVTMRFTVRHRPAAGAATQRTFQRKVTLRVKRRRR
jgi:uncharacterized protein DUF4394